MPRDYTDYVALVFGGGERVYHIRHFRQLKNDDEVNDFELNGRRYLLNKDRAMRIRGWAPWKKIYLKRPVHTLNELLRGKKIGLIIYREPSDDKPTTKPVERRTVIDYTCKICDFQTEHERSIKTHITRKHRGAKHELVATPRYETKTFMELVTVEPMHISRIHQPSGVMR